jgi:ribonuclease/clavin/mitogillin
MIARVPVDAPTRSPTGRTAAYVLGDSDALVVDPAARTPALDQAVRESDAAHLAVTHHHPDHVGAVAEYAEAFDLTVWALAGRADAFTAATGVEPDRLLRPGSTIPATPPVAVMDTPGHAPEHLSFRLDDALVTGDLAVAEGSVVVGAPAGDMRAYLSSLRRLHARAPDRLYPAHGPVIDDPRGVCRRLIDHRLDREQNVLAAVNSGARTPEEIVDAAYEKDVSAVFDLARATVVAHLEKLAVERKISWDGGAATPL